MEYALPVHEAQLDPAGRVWLGLESQDAGMRWMWLDSKLRPVGETRIPADERIMDVSDGMFLIVRHDSLDVPFIRIYRVDTGERAGVGSAA